MSVPIWPDDPAYFMLQNGLREQQQTPDEYNWRSRTTVYDDNCYICRDPEFALMGLPLCRECSECTRNGRKGHVPADDSTCTMYGHDEESEHTEPAE